MERALSYLYVFPLIAMGIWSRLTGQDDTEAHLRNKYPHLYVREWTDGTE